MVVLAAYDLSRLGSDLMPRLGFPILTYSERCPWGKRGN